MGTRPKARMRRPSRSRALALAGLITASAMVAAAPAAAVVHEKSLTYSCDYPFNGPRPVTVEISTEFPAVISRGMGFNAIVMIAVSEAGGTPTVGGYVGSVDASARVSLGDASTVQALTPLPENPPSPLATPQPYRLGIGVGNTPATQGTVDLESFALALQAVDEIGNPVEGSEPFTVPCTPAPPTQPLQIASFGIDGEVQLPLDALFPVSTPVVSEVNGTSAKVCWDPLNNRSRNTTGVVGLPAGAQAVPIADAGDGLRCDRITGLSPAMSYTLFVQASNPINTGNVATFKVDTFFSGTPCSAPDPTQVSYGYDLAGSATLKTLVKGSLPLKGGIAAKLGVPSGCFSADLTLNQTTGNLTALGFLPVTAVVSIIPTEKVTGQLKSGVLRANAKVRIKLPKVSLFGVQIGGGASCQAKQISSIALQSTQAQFLPLTGGPIAGTFSISDLTGCGALNGIISPLTAGKGNAILLNLTPKA